MNSNARTSICSRALCAALLAHAPAALGADADFDPAYGNGDGQIVVSIDVGGSLRDTVSEAFVDPGGSGRITLVGNAETGGDLALAAVAVAPNGALVFRKHHAVDALAIAAAGGPGRTTVVALEQRGADLNETDMLVVRLTAAGEFDTTFSLDGRELVDFVEPAIDVSDVAVDAAGTIAALYRSAGERIVSRRAPDGTAGKITRFDDSVASDPGRLAYQRDGRLVVALGRINATGPRCTVQLLRFLAGVASDDYALDPGFSIAPVSITATQCEAAVEDLHVDAQDRLVVLARSSSDGHHVLRYRTDGTPDTSFGGDGRVDIVAATTRLMKVRTQSDGRFVLGGRNIPGGSVVEFAVLRLTAAGVPDTSFNAGQPFRYLRFAVQGGADSTSNFFSGLEIESTTDRIVLAGWSRRSEPFNDDFVIGRLLGSSRLFGHGFE